MAVSDPEVGEVQGVSAEVLANFWRCEQTTVRELWKQGIAVRLKHNRYKLMESTSNLIVYYRRLASGHASGEHDLVKENARLKAAQRTLVEMRIAQQEGKLVLEEDVENTFADHLMRVKQMILAVPVRARFDIPHLTAKDQKALERIVNELLNEAAAPDTRTPAIRSGKETLSVD
jgi:phage terminase Nu1 subunit (DNA packaging protein)